MSGVIAPLSESHRLHKLRKAAWGGGKARVPTGPIWAHIDRLVAEGWPLVRIAEAADVDVQLIHQRHATMHKAKAARIFMVDRARMYAMASDNDHVPAVGARRRIQALHAIGWSCLDIIPTGSVASRAAQPHRKVVSAATWRQVAEAYDRLSMTHGNGRQAARRARKNGWPPPLCWDDDDIDDPKAEPARARTRGDDRRGPRAEMLEQVAELTQRGMSAAAIAIEFGVNKRTIQRCRSELADTNDLGATG